MIVNDINTAMKYLPSVNLKVDSSRLLDFFTSAQNEVMRMIIGIDIEEILEDAVSTPDAHAKLRELTSRAICLTAYIRAIPELDLQLSEMGFVVASNDYASPASKERVERLMTRLKMNRSLAYDDLLTYLLSNSSSEMQYADWRLTTQYLYLSSGLVADCKEMLKFKNIVQDYSSDVDFDYFYNSIQSFRFSLSNIISDYVSIDYINELIAKIRNNTLTQRDVEVLETLKAAVVAFDLKNKKFCIDLAIIARSYMINHIADFQTFKNSSAYTRSISSVGDKSILNMI